MKFTDQINATGDYDLNEGRPTDHDQGMIVIYNINAAHTYTLGYKGPEGTFKAFEGAASTLTEDTAVFCGKGTNLVVRVGGTVGGSDNLQFGWAG